MRRKLRRTEYEVSFPSMNCKLVLCYGFAFTLCWTSAFRAYSGLSLTSLFRGPYVEIHRILLRLPVYTPWAALGRLSLSPIASYSSCCSFCFVTSFSISLLFLSFPFLSFPFLLPFLFRCYLWRFQPLCLTTTPLNLAVNVGRLFHFTHMMVPYPFFSSYFILYFDCLGGFCGLVAFVSQSSSYLY